MNQAPGKILKPGEKIGIEENFRALAAEQCTLETFGTKKRAIFSEPWLLASYAWTTTLSEQRIEIEEIDEFRFKCLFHWVVDTPVHAATDHPSWTDDVSIVFNTLNSSHAFVTAMRHDFRRGCGRYLHEIPAQQYASEVAWPVRNMEWVQPVITFRLRVTAC